MVKTNYVGTLAALLAALLAASLLLIPGLPQVAFSQEKEDDKDPAKEQAAAQEEQGTIQSTVRAITNSRGPLTKIAISNELNCQVNHKFDGTSAEFYPTSSTIGACGTFLSVGGTLYSPSDVPAGGSAEGTPFTPVSQSAVSGSGTQANPYKIVTKVNAGTTGLQIIQTDSYVVGQESYRTDVKVQNLGGSSQDAILYRAGDCYLQNSDFGLGSADAATGAVSCVVGVENSLGETVPGERYIEWKPLTAGSSYYEARYSEIWSKIGAQQAFGNSCSRCSEYIDNGAGLSWNITVPAGGQVTYSHLTTLNTGDPPTVADWQPQGTGVVRNTNVTATFSENMDLETLVTSPTDPSDPLVGTSRTVKLINTATGTRVPATVSCDDDPCTTVTLDPSVNLGSFKKYKAIIMGGLSGARDLQGNPLAQNKVWNFTTGNSFSAGSS